MQDKITQRSLDGLFEVASAGTHSYHVGCAPDQRSVACARLHGIEMRNLRARQLTVNDYHDFDYLLAMDKKNLAVIQHRAPGHHKAHIQLFLEFARHAGTVTREEVPDPYSGGEKGFVDVFDLIERGCEALLRGLQKM